MGLIAKSNTKKRIAPIAGPVNATLQGSPWQTTGNIPVGSLVRSAVFSLELLKLRSSQSRGRVAVALSGQTTVWVEMLNWRTWSLIMGVPRVPEGIAADWAMDLEISNDAKQASMSTTHYLTKDDALVHGDEHDTLRRTLMGSLAAAQPANPDAESEVIAGSLDRAQPFATPPPDPFLLSFEYGVAFSPSESRDRLLRHMGYRVIDQNDRTIRFALGLPRCSAEDRVSMSFADGSVGVDAAVRSDSGISRRLAWSDLYAFVQRSNLVLTRDGSEPKFRGPSGWAP